MIMRKVRAGCALFGENGLKISSIKKKVIDWTAVFAGKGIKRSNEAKKDG